MTWMDCIGLGAGLFVILAFYMREQRSLRVCAIVSNILFVIYGAALSLWPIFLLHALLLPLNAYRLTQVLRDCERPQLRPNFRVAEIRHTSAKHL
jgi:hypothetical protein